MNRIKINIIRALATMFLLVLFVFAFTYLRFFIVILFACAAVVDLIRKKSWGVAEIAVVVVLYFSMMPGWFPSMFQNLERVRFMILQKQYAIEVENVVNTYPDDMDYQIIGDCNWMLTSHGNVNYKRNGNSTIVFFMTDYTRVSGYVYYSDETACGWMADCARIEELRDHWLMVQMYD